MSFFVLHPGEDQNQTKTRPFPDRFQTEKGGVPKKPIQNPPISPPKKGGRGQDAFQK
jgi:hypothetical protein